MKQTALIVWISLLVQVCQGAGGHYARKLLNDLMEDYSNALRPVGDTDKALNVSLQITLSQIKDMDERNQVLTTYLWIRQVWHDAYLKWNKEDYDDLEMINIPSDLVWKPDIVLYNKADEESSGPSNTNVKLRYNGEIVWDSPAITKSTCVVDVSYFPFDWQQCNLTFGSWTYNGNQVAVSLGMDSGDLSDFVENVEWECHGMPAVSLGVTVLLALTVFQLLVAESMPPAESMPYIGKYYIATMIMITASTSLTIFIMNIHFCGAEAKPVPHWAKVLIIDYMSKILFVYEVGENCTTPECEKSLLYPDETVSEMSFDPDIHHLGSDSYKHNDGHSIHHHHSQHCKKQVHVKENNTQHYKNHGHQPEGKDGMGEATQHYHHHVTNDEDYKAAPHASYLHHLNGGLKEQILYPEEKHQIPACPCSCPCLQHNQVVKNIQYMANCFREQRTTCIKAAEWKKVAKVMDRFFMWIFFIMVFLMSILIIAKAS
ncbi:neuronal acetylcholine receptor subunit alpha-9-I isoform 3-T3 [Syngnathus typhle]